MRLSSGVCEKVKKIKTTLLYLYIFVTFMSGIIITLLDKNNLWISILILLQFVGYLIIYQLLQKKYRNLEPIVNKINNNYPIQYLIGNVDFYGYTIKVNEDVLIPRFETETLVEKTIDLINKLKLEKASVLDVGTGSGCISIALKCEIPTLEITAIDKSRKALNIARKNAKFNKVKINFICKDLFTTNHFCKLLFMLLLFYCSIL